MNIRRLRTQKGLTQVQLAKRARVSQAYVALLEGRVRSNPSIAVAKRLAKALGVPITKLIR